MFLLVICQILGLFVNTLTVDDNYSLCYRKNLQQATQIELSKKQKTFSQFVAAFSKLPANFENFEKKLTLIAQIFPKRSLNTTKISKTSL